MYRAYFVRRMLEEKEALEASRNALERSVHEKAFRHFRELLELSNRRAGPPLRAGKPTSKS